jgi:nitrogen fixation protein FixH
MFQANALKPSKPFLSARENNPLPMADSPKPNARRWDPWPVSIIVFFAIAVAGCVGFVVFCSRHPADLVAADYYDREIRYQGQIDSLSRTRASGLKASVSVDAAQKSIVVRIPKEQLAGGVSGNIELYRPSSEKLDRKLALALGTDGRQTINASDLPDGLWKVRVSWTADGQSYLLDEKVVLGGVSSR